MKYIEKIEIEYYFKLLDSFPALIWHCGIDAKCDYFNKSWLDFRGRTLAQECNDGWINGVHQEDIKRNMEIFLDSFNKRIPFTIEYRLKRFDGVYRNIIDYVHPIYSINNNFNGYISAAYDITDRIESDLIIKNSIIDFNKLSTAVHQSPNTIVITNLNGEIEFVNKKFSDTSGYTAEEAIGKNPRILKTNYLPTEAYSNLWTTISNGNIWNGDFLNKKKNGELYWERAIISPVFDSVGKIINYIAIKEDITEQKIISEKLNSQEKVNNEIAFISKEFLKSDITIEEISTLAVKSCVNITKSLLGIVPMVNQENYNLESGIIIKNDNGICKFENNNNHIVPFENGRYNSLIGHALNFNESFYTNNIFDFNKYKPIPENHISIFNILSVPAIVNNKKIGIVCLANKEEGFTENDLKNVEKITNIFALAIFRKLTEQELMIAKIKAEESDKLKSSFLANMSHEIRTPMNAIIGFAELLKKSDIKPEKKEKYIEHINQNCHSLSSLINDIIDISRIETNSILIHHENFIIGKVLTEIFEQFQLENNRLNKVSVKLILEIEEGLFNKSIYSDIMRFKQIISNLLSNAIKFTKNGFIVLGCIKENKGFIKIYVKDTGIGIPVDAQSLIFERFRQEDGSITRNYGGSGLGLPISKSLIKLLGGTIGVFSQKDIGSEFYITIPCDYVSEKNKDKLNHQANIENIKEYNWKGNSILFVDDDKDTQDLFIEIIDDTGIKYFIANNGKEAINICTNEHIDIVLLDIHMPGINGIETKKMIRDLNKNIKIIAQTADIVSKTEDEFKNIGFNDVIIKPFNIEKVLFLINNYLKH